MSDKQNVFSQIRNSCAYVASKSSHVKLNNDAIPLYADALDLDYANNPIMDTENHYVGNEEETIAYFVILDAINFGSGYFDELKKINGKTGYCTIAYYLKDWFISTKPRVSDLLKITPDICANIFSQDMKNNAANELMTKFSSALNELGEFISLNYDNSFYSLIESCNNSANKLVLILSKMKHFMDSSSYKNQQVYFYKRAQIMASDINIALSGRNIGHFEDINELTIFADNLVPHVLKQDGILQFSEELDAKINSNTLIRPGSEEEIEIRACAVHAVELIKNYINTHGNATTSQHLDYLLWNKGQNPKYRTTPRHATRTIFY